MLSSKTLIISQVTLSAILGQPNVMQGVISDGLASRAAKLQWCRPSAVFFHYFYKIAGCLKLLKVFVYHAVNQCLCLT